MRNGIVFLSFHSCTFCNPVSPRSRFVRRPCVKYRRRNGERSKNNRGGDRVVGTCPHRGMVPNRISSGFCAWYERDNDAVSYRYTSLLTNITSILFRVYIYTMSASIIHCFPRLIASSPLNRKESPLLEILIMIDAFFEFAIFRGENLVTRYILNENE